MYFDSEQGHLPWQLDYVRRTYTKDNLRNTIVAYYSILYMFYVNISPNCPV